jgi:hypothetical protein
MPKIFISYRREDCRHVTGRVYDRLVGAFGPASVFKDVDSLPLGIDFRRALNDQVAQCDVLLAVIGDAWLRADGTGGARRIDSETDFVRIEIEAALKRDIPVVPLLVGDAPVPKERELPPSLAQLAYRNGTTLREDPHFGADMERLIRALRQIKSATAMTDSAKAVFFSGDHGPHAAQPADVVTAEAVVAPPPTKFVDDPSADAQANEVDWLAIARWALVTIVVVICITIGVEGSGQLGTALALAALPAFLTIALFPHVYRGTWIWTRQGTLAQFRRHHTQLEGQVVYGVAYVSAVLILLIFGIGYSSGFWPAGMWGFAAEPAEPAATHFEPESGPTVPGESTAPTNGGPAPAPGLDTSPILDPERFKNLFPPVPPKEGSSEPMF